MEKPKKLGSIEGILAPILLQSICSSFLGSKCIHNFFFFVISDQNLALSSAFGHACAKKPEIYSIFQAWPDVGLQIRF
jgi:hypothetical protein